MAECYKKYKMQMLLFCHVADIHYFVAFTFPHCPYVSFHCITGVRCCMCILLIFEAEKFAIIVVCFRLKSQI